MPDKDAGTPRVFITRHGETEWSKIGRYTGATELELTPTGEEQVLGTGRMLIGTGKLVDPSKLVRVWVSPRKRAYSTYRLLFEDSVDAADTILDFHCDRLAEWDYGAYEGMLPNEIRQRRKGQGLDQDQPWDIWKDGCEGGETPEKVTARLDDLIQAIHAIQGPNMHGEKACDVLLIAHGHILRAFVKRWLKYPLETPLSLMLEPGGIGILSYQHHSIDEPAMIIGMSLPLLKKP